MTYTHAYIFVHPTCEAVYTFINLSETIIYSTSSVVGRRSKIKDGSHFSSIHFPEDYSLAIIVTMSGESQAEGSLKRQMKEIVVS